jgi:hypothetical protein
MTNEEQTEELLIKAHKLGFHQEMIDLAVKLIQRKTERHHAYHMAYIQLKNEYDEIHGK